LVVYVERKLNVIHNRNMNGKQLAVLLAVIGAAAVLLNVNNSSNASEFESWKSKHGIKFASEFENAYRERIFLENLAKINSHNSNPYKTYEQGLNQFSALTTEEFSQQYLGTIVPESSNNIENNDYEVIGDIDWVGKGAVTAVKNQGQCGSCWAFSATGGLEGLSFLADGTLGNFSEQQLVDCSGTYGNQACNGGLMDNAFKFVKDHGITNEDAYPYKAVKQTCKTNSGDFKITGFTDIKNCNDLANALVGRPISIAVDATNWSPYKSGVFSNCKTSLNHGVLLVGTDGDNWVVKNSWGASWGEKGFIRLAKGNTCGLCNVASYPTK
jgi:C1A family cysteine protease